TGKLTGDVLSQFAKPRHSCGSAQDAQGREQGNNREFLISLCKYLYFQSINSNLAATICDAEGKYQGNNREIPSVSRRGSASGIPAGRSLGAVSPMPRSLKNQLPAFCTRSKPRMAAHCCPRCRSHRMRPPSNCAASSGGRSRWKPKYLRLIRSHHGQRSSSDPLG